MSPQSESRASSISEINKHSQAEVHNDQDVLKLFRRAMLQHDDRAWELLQQWLNPLMLGWVRRHPQRELACRLDSEENYVDLAWERFWIATVRNQELQFRTLDAALSFLHATLNSTIIDTLRAHLPPREIPLPEPGYFGEPAVEDSYDNNEIWEVVKGLLPDLHEQRLAFLLFHCGLRPREIVRFYPQEFSNVREVHRVRRNILDRLSRKRDQIRWQLGDASG